jgi:hypothetical protein
VRLAWKVEQELQLSPREFEVGEQVAHIVHTATSRRTGRQTVYDMELFRVRFTALTAEGIVVNNPANRWLTAEEIKDRKAADERPVSETMLALLARANWPT